jgi:hypothetical protein
MRVSLLALSLSSALAAAQSQRAADHVLDILTYRVTPETSAPANPSTLPAGGGVSGGESTQRPRGTLKVTLLSLDRLSYETGDPVIYEVWIENTGNRPVVLPWSPDLVRFRGPGPIAPPSVEALVFLEVRDRARSRALAQLEPSMLFGSRAVAGSLATLAPRETAWMRVPGFWRTSEREMQAMLSETDGVVQVAAAVHVLRTPLRVHSTNSLEVSVRSRHVP